MKNFRTFAKFLSVISLLFFAACVIKNDQPQVRIVDLQGRAKPVKTRFPELNAQALASQGFSSGARDINQPAQDVGYRSSSRDVADKDATKEIARSDFGASSAQSMKETLQPSASKESKKDEFSDQENPSVVKNAGSGSGNEPVQYDLTEAKSDDINESNSVVVVPAKKTSKKSNKKIVLEEVAPREISNSGKKFFAQVGSFSSRANAEATLAKMKKFHLGKVEVSKGEKTVYRVWLGPVSDRKQANALIKKIKDSGGDAVLVRGK